MAERIAFFGELLLRLTAPGKELLLQSPALQVHVGGAEANVAVGLASLGHDTRMISRVPANALGRAAVSEIRKHGVDCRSVAADGDGRMGLYFLTAGAGLRASEVVYDRAGSAFALADPSSWDWDSLLAGCTRLHLSGITPALGPGPAVAAIAAAEAASRLGLAVSFDGNYRARLWEAWDSRPREILSRLVGFTDILFGNHRDIALLLDRPFKGDTPADRRTAAEAAFGAFPRLKLIAATHRIAEDAGSNRLAARADTPKAHTESDPLAITGIVDRIGAGDAFAAGILHGLIEELPLAETVEAGLALTALKHSLPGDASLFTRADLAAFESGGRDVRR